MRQSSLQDSFLLQRTAEITPCGLYRIRLTRRWSDAPMMILAMLNASTADAEIDDPTITRGMGFARREKAGGLEVVNMSAYRATDPRDLVKAGVLAHCKENEAVLHRLLLACGEDHRAIVCAWGSHPFARKWSIWFINKAQNLGVTLVCLGKTKDGSPRHPLYVRADQPLEAFP